MAEYLIKGESLAEIADAIRTVTGKTAGMTPAGMAAEIAGTVVNAVDDALSAIAEKGVTVPDGTKVDGLAALIAAIETGGGVKIASGSFTLPEDLTIASDASPWVQTYTIQHGLGVVPQYYLLFSSRQGTASSQYEFIAGFVYPINNDKSRGTVVFSATGGGYSSGIANMIGISNIQPYPRNIGFNENTVPYMRHGYNKTTKYLASQTYYWVVIAEETA